MVLKVNICTTFIHIPYLHACIHTHTLTNIHKYMHTCTDTQNIHTHTTPTYTHTHAHIHIQLSHSINMHFTNLHTYNENNKLFLKNKVQITRIGS